jgi:hypothetical protein
MRNGTVSAIDLGLEVLGKTHPAEFYDFAGAARAALPQF